MSSYGYNDICSGSLTDICWRLQILTSMVEVTTVNTTTSFLDKKDESRRTMYRKCISMDSVVVEVGVWHGLNAQLIYSEFNPKKLYLVDPWVNQSTNDLYALEKGSLPQRTFDIAYGVVTEFFDSKDNVKIIRSFSKDAVEEFEDESIDVIYIDAGHYFDAVWEDFTLWYPKIKKGGYMCGDDYFVRANQKYGVIQAIDQFLEEYDDMEIVFFDEEKTFPLPGCGQFCLLKKKEETHG